MIKYFHIYNEITRIIRKVELVLAGKISKKICNFDSGYIYGPAVYSYFIRNLVSNDGNYEKLKNLSDINDLPDYKKFIMNKKGFVYTTPTGFVAANYFYVYKNKNHDGIIERIHDDRTDYFCKRIKIIL